MRRHRLKDCIDDFRSMNVKIAKIDLDENEYSNINVARSVIGVSIKRFGYPVDITKRKGELYLVRRDI